MTERIPEGAVVETVAKTLRVREVGNYGGQANIVFGGSFGGKCAHVIYSVLVRAYSDVSSGG